LLALRSFGRTSLREIKRKLEDLNLTLGMQLPQSVDGYVDLSNAMGDGSKDIDEDEDGANHDEESSVAMEENNSADDEVIGLAEGDE
jgi:hypothetical protein